MNNEPQRSMPNEVTPEVLALARELWTTGWAAHSAACNAAGMTPRPMTWDGLTDTLQAGWLAIARHVLTKVACARRELQELHAQELGALYSENAKVDEKTHCGVCEVAYSDANPRVLTPANQYICRSCDNRWLQMMARGVSGAELLRRNAVQEGGAK